MKKGFTKLEIILVGIILLFAIGFLSTKALSLFGGNKFTLEQRFNKLISLQNDKKYSELYDSFIYPDEKINLTKDEFIKSFSNSKVIKSIPQINNITIKDNIGYIDRSLTICLNESCTDKQILRGYKKWIFQNGNWYVTSEEVPCLRETPYEKPSEFDRALSLMKQRINTKISSLGMKEYDFSFFNCLDIQYANLKGMEGLFSFTEGSSSPDRLLIEVNNSYKENDDLLTAYLLTHEVFHASTYLNKINFGTDTSCVDNEANSFRIQLVFLASLNPQEWNSIAQRFNQGYFRLNPPLQAMWDMTVLDNNARVWCGNDMECYEKKLRSDIKSSIINNPYYQKQCGLN